jgi:hypothetical protein
VLAPELLTAQRKLCKHGQWLAWLQANVQFSRKTGDNYRSIYLHRDKFVNVTNLTDAYRIAVPKQLTVRLRVNRERIPTLCGTSHEFVRGARDRAELPARAVRFPMIVLFTNVIFEISRLLMSYEFVRDGRDRAESRDLAHGRANHSSGLDDVDCFRR